MNPRRPDPAACLLALLLSAPALPGHAQPASADVRPVGAAEARRYVLSRTPEELARAEASGPLASESDKLAAEAVRLIKDHHGSALPSSVAQSLPRPA
jgi:hypothetical protein